MKSRTVAKVLQAGFTLIELIIVIVIVGILAAVAIPKYFDLQRDAQVATLQGVAGALSSAAATNYALRSASKGTTVAVTTCDAALLTMPAGIAATGTAPGTVAAGTTFNCAVNYSTGALTGTPIPINATFIYIP